mgnify:CR=1 FL=1
MVSSSFLLVVHNTVLDTCQSACQGFLTRQNSIVATLNVRNLPLVLGASILNEIPVLSFSIFWFVGKLLITFVSYCIYCKVHLIFFAIFYFFPCLQSTVSFSTTANCFISFVTLKLENG